MLAREPLRGNGRLSSIPPATPMPTVFFNLLTGPTSVIGSTRCWRSNARGVSAHRDAGDLSRSGALGGRQLPPGGRPCHAVGLAKDRSGRQRAPDRRSLTPLERRAHLAALIPPPLLHRHLYRRVPPPPPVVATLPVPPPIRRVRPPRRPLLARPISLAGGLAIGDAARMPGGDRPAGLPRRREKVGEPGVRRSP